MTTSTTSVALGITQPFIFQEDSHGALYEKLSNLVEQLASGYEAYVSSLAPEDVPENSLPGFSANVHILPDPDDHPEHSYYRMGELFDTADDLIRQRGYFVLSASTVCIDLLDLLEKGKIPQDNRGRAKAIGWRLSCIPKDQAHVLSELDQDGDPRYAFLWGLNRSNDSVRAAAAITTLGQ